MRLHVSVLLLFDGDCGQRLAAVWVCFAFCESVPLKVGVIRPISYIIILVCHVRVSDGKSIF